ncbi:hypothetical protein P7C70_g9272, partial [Phenoliferia sp. Uapishka_3]
MYSELDLSAVYVNPTNAGPFSSTSSTSQSSHSPLADAPVDERHASRANEQRPVGKTGIEGSSTDGNNVEARDARQFVDLTMVTELQARLLAITAERDELWTQVGELERELMGSQAAHHDESLRKAVEAATQNQRLISKATADELYAKIEISESDNASLTTRLRDQDSLLVSCSAAAVQRTQIAFGNQLILRVDRLDALRDETRRAFESKFCLKDEYTNLKTECEETLRDLRLVAVGGWSPDAALVWNQDKLEEFTSMAERDKALIATLHSTVDKLAYRISQVRLMLEVTSIGSLSPLCT